ncbi:hypothetical protein [Anaerofustis sp.]|nr:hypothetical protein [Anaerofustis sp.]
MKNNEIKRFIHLLQTLNKDKQKELYFMLIKGYSAGIKVKNANVGTV